MSNIIPILSSSPPPIDDTPSFEDDWDNEDFGGFQGASPSGGTPAFANNIPGSPVPGGQQQQQPQQQQHHPQQQHAKCIEKPGVLKLPNDSAVVEDDGNWADFSGPAPPPVVDGEFVAFPSNNIQTGPSSSVSNTTCPDDDDDLSADTPSGSASMGLQLHSTTDRTVAHGDGSKSQRSSSSSSGTQEEGRNSSNEDFSNTKPHDNTSKIYKPDSQDNTSQDSVTDSGLCSDISPVPKFEEYPDFGDNKSSEVEFSDEGVTPVSTTTRVSLEQDEGFANFTTFDSCGTGSDKSPETLSHKVDTDLDPLDFRQTEVAEGEMDQFSGFSCAGCDGSQDGEAVTPTQSQYDVENVSSNSLSPNIQSSPEQERVDETVDQTSPPVNTLNQNDSPPAESNDSSNPLEDIAPDHSKDDASLSDFQSTHSEANSSSAALPQDDEDGGCNRPTSACDSSGTETHIAADTEPSIEPSPTDASTSSSSAPVATVSSQVQKTPDKRTPSEDEVQQSGPEEDDWEFQDALAVQSAPETESPPQVTEPGETAENKDSEDEFGDFATLPNATAPVVKLEGETSVGDSEKKAEESGQGNDDEEGKEKEQEEEDDWAFQGGTFGEENFGNFASTAPGEGFAAFDESPDAGGGDENWASFSEPAQLPATVDDNDDDDDDKFGDFDDATFESSVPQNSVSPSQLPEVPVTTAVGRIFGLASEEENLPPADLLFVYMTKQVIREEQQVLSKQPGRHPNIKSVSVDVNVWNNLRDLEKTAALRYSWDKSTNNGCLLKSLSIDTRNILIGHKKSSVPIFASNLGVGVLEPSRGLPEVGREGRVSEVGVTALASTTKLTAGTPQDIPPAEFDWSSAGLTNPLDSSNVQLDLDFFVKKTAWSGPAAYTATSPTAALENELLKAIEPEQSKQPKTLEPLENYLANLKVASTAPPSLGKESDADQLTEPAFNMVSRLPDLSFMRAKMLMFPVKGTGD